MRAYFQSRRKGDPWAEAADAVADLVGMDEHPVVLEPRHIPLRQVWLGVSVEDRARKPRIDDLRATPAAIRFLSCEPLIEDLGALNLEGIGWVICGGESGPRSRPMHPDWARSLRGEAQKMVRAHLDHANSLGAWRTVTQAPWPATLDRLHEHFPNFGAMTSLIQRHLSLCQRNPDRVLHQHMNEEKPQIVAQGIPERL